ncbi:MAG: C-terminal binding protein [Acidobacteriota bacterium]|nr:C-terminal binding protein [Acidobacteriota bacterium]
MEQDVFIVDSHQGPYLEEPDIEREVLSPEARPILRRVNSAEELIGLVDDAAAVISWHTIPLPASVIARLKNCRGIVRSAAGYDNIDIDYAAQRGIPVAVVPDYGIEEVADHTLALLLALVRKLHIVGPRAKNGEWDWRAVGRVPRLRGLRLGLVGFGRIGSAVARRAQAFGLQVAFYDPYLPSGVEKVHAVTRHETLHELLDWSQVISVHVPLTPETRHIIGPAELARLRPETMLINTARGDVIDQQALIESLVAGHIGQVGLDVLSSEPEVPEALRSSERVLLTAHSAFYADESLAEVRYKAAASVRRLLNGQPERNIVNGVVPRPDP